MQISFKSSTLQYLIPREHGAWAMWITPLILGMIFSGISIDSVIFSHSALFLFLAYGPLSMVIKSPRKQKENLQAFVFAGVLFCIPGIVLALRRFSLMMAMLGILCFMLFGIHLMIRRFGKGLTILGYIPGVAGLTMTAPFVILIDTGTVNSLAVILWITCFLYFFTTTFYIRLRIRIQARVSVNVSLREKLQIGGPAILASIIPVIIMLISHLPLLAVSYLPGMLKALWGSLFFLPGEKPRPVVLGITEIIFTLVFMILMVIVLHGKDW